MSDPVAEGFDCKRPFAWTPQGFQSFEAFLDSALRIDLGPVRPPCLINLREDRYQFARCLVAGWRRGIGTLLPPDRSPRHLEALQALYPGALLLPETAAERGPDDAKMAAPTGAAWMQDPSRCLAFGAASSGVTAFTSGTTGAPLAYQKSFVSLAESARLIDQHLGGMRGVAVVATVPCQHMYGLELGILLPLFRGAILTPARPFFPADIQKALEDTPAPRLLVTTPVHLKACLDSGLDFPPLKAVVSATAPLSRRLAEAAEMRFKAPLYEIYGCTEGGSLAGRLPVRSRAWQWFENVRVTATLEGLTTVRALHVPDEIPLADVIRPLDQRSFELEGRCGDLINVAGKRSSIASLNRIAQEFNGVEDASFFMPDAGPSGTTVRLVLFVQVADGGLIPRLERHLREQIDPAFWPRLIYRVHQLPRNATGKLPRAALQSLLNEAVTALN